MKVYKSAIVIILIALVLPLISAYGSDADLVYKTHNSGSCDISVKNSAGTEKLYDINVLVWSEGNKIYQKFDGTPGLPAPTDYRDYGTNNCQPYGLDFGEILFFWDLVKWGSIQNVVDSCPDSSIKEMSPGNAIPNLKCSQYCEPNKAICTAVGTLRKCSIDGLVIETINCPFGCDDSDPSFNYCRSAETAITTTTDKVTYDKGEDITVTGTFISAGAPVQGIRVYAQLLKGDTVHSELSGSQYVTDANGKVTFIFLKPTIAGETNVKLYIQGYLGRDYQDIKTIQIPGENINYEVTTYSYTQYSAKNITFDVKMNDSKGIEIIPAQITNLKSVVNLAQGKVLSSSINYLGYGLYEVSSIVNGSGAFVGKIEFDFEGLPQSSPVITIDVRTMGVSIDTSKINPGAYLNNTKEYTISIADSSGIKIDPDNIWIVVSLPDGTTVKNIPFTEITRVSEGVYKFTYTFTQVEKHTFDIYADYKNYARGSARASVAISGAGDDFGPGPGFGFGNLPYFLYAGIIIAVIWFIIYRKKNKGKIKTWLWHNKEGVAIGAIAGGVISYLAINGGTTFAFLMDFIGIITGIFNNAEWAIWFVGVGAGILIGALIDSYWRPNR